MRSIFSKFALVAGITLALAFTFSCSSDDTVCDDDGYVCCAGCSGSSSSVSKNGGSSSSVTGGGGSSSSSSSGGNGNSNTWACKYIYTFNEPINGKSSGEYCWEISERLKPGSTEIVRPINEVKQEMITFCAGKPGGVFYDSCPSGYVLKCFTGDNDFNHNGYFYGNEFKGLSCKDVVDKL
jgi:hypothetical protein